MITNQEFHKFTCNISIERLKSFVYSQDDTMDDIIERYIDNIKISKSLYPELSVLEVSLRNSINSVFETQFSESWIEDEVKNNRLLDEDDYNLLISAYKKQKKNVCQVQKNLHPEKLLLILISVFGLIYA